MCGSVLWSLFSTRRSCVGNLSFDGVCWQSDPCWVMFEHTEAFCLHRDKAGQSLLWYSLSCLKGWCKHSIFTVFIPIVMVLCTFLVFQINYLEKHDCGVWCKVPCAPPGYFLQGRWCFLCTYYNCHGVKCEAMILNFWGIPIPSLFLTFYK